MGVSIFHLVSSLSFLVLHVGVKYMRPCVCKSIDLILGHVDHIGGLSVPYTDM